MTVLAGRPEVWRVEDSLLAAAFARYKASRVGPSGYPWRKVSEATDNWNVDVRVDHAQAALDKWEKENRDRVEPGSVPTVFWHEIITPAMRRAKREEG